MQGRVFVSRGGPSGEGSSTPPPPAGDDLVRERLKGLGYLG